MKKIILFVLFQTFFTINCIAQKYFEQINVGDYFPNDINIGGWKPNNVDPNFMEGFICKSYLIKSIEKINNTPGLAYELQKNGGTLEKRIYFFMNSENKVIGIREIEFVVYAGSNALSKFLKNKKRVSQYIIDFGGWKFLDEFEYSNLNRYFAYTVEPPDSSINEKAVFVEGINDNRYSFETYLPNNNYLPLFLVGDPNEKKVKSTNQLIISKDYLYNLCSKTIGVGEKASDKCDCFYEKAFNYLKENKNRDIKDNILQNKLMGFLMQCD